MRHVFPSPLFAFIALSISSLMLYSFLVYHFSLPALVSDVLPSAGPDTPSLESVDADWHPPNATWITDLSDIINGTGVHGFIFNNSYPEDVAYGNYNWCNMPHVRQSEYVVPGPEFELEYVELIHRHHKRTPYAANTFPHEPYSWHCSDEGLFYYAQPLGLIGESAASTYWSVYTSPVNPFAPSGFNGTCQFPQITREGLEDSYQHGVDLFAVYHDSLNFLPDTPDDTTKWRVTNNVITSQVGSMVTKAMYPEFDGPFPLQIQPVSVDSLEPAYLCLAATYLSGNFSVGSNNPAWTAHLNASSTLFAGLDVISGVPKNDTGFHQSWDHYFDNLSARQCHSKPLPCNITDPTACVSQDQANEVYRIGQWEYSYIHRGSSESLRTATAAYGVWFMELADSIRRKITGSDPTIYRHNIAHDGSISRVLSILQVDVMVWPGMGSEIIFEIYKRPSSATLPKRYVRVLWGGKVLRSSNPSLGLMNMLDVDVLLTYIDKLGVSNVLTLCRP
ncbi:hypothetical protein FKW77_000612 [Venturia effusa]|uniref:Histidine acid phosphatase n=1 Tax=Venturia effusa TaxID=50376 RepID=A0A517KVQ3_9PEZI|nr:hypothetical protein FKW77_000612 [Venturia effusa]